MNSDEEFKKIRLIVDSLHQFLFDLLSEELKTGGWRIDASADEIIKRHLKPEDRIASENISDILSSMLFSAQNRQDANRVIQGSVENGWEGLRDILLNFDPENILDTWSDSEELFEFIKRSGRVRGAMRDGNRSRWPQFCKSVLSAARFMSQFERGEEFILWADSFFANPNTAAALPLVLAEEIDGFGLALACDFLKELGYIDLPKPDVHIKRLAYELQISSANSDYILMRDLMRLKPVLRRVGLTVYAFDKYLWLIGSGRFYLVRDGGRELSIGRQSAAFLDFMAGRG